MNGHRDGLARAKALRQPGRCVFCPVPDWIKARAATRKALRELPRCEYTDGCEGRAMGLLAKLDPFRLVLACPRCAQRARAGERVRHG